MPVDSLFTLFTVFVIISNAICCAYAAGGVPTGSVNHEKDAIIGTSGRVRSRSLVIAPPSLLTLTGVAVCWR